MTSIYGIPPLVALVDDTRSIDRDTLSEWSAALNKQVVRDLYPVWHVHATVTPFSSLAVVPLGYWPIVIAEDINAPGAAGYHTDWHGQPLALVQLETLADTFLTCSHELVETLVDPFGNRLVVVTIDHERVRVLVEACDPCEATSYPVDDWDASDFVLPAYYGPHRWSGGVKSGTRQLTFCDVIRAPLTIQQGGYLSYVKQDGSWWQKTWFSGAQPKTVDISDRLAQLSEGAGTLRSAIDRIVREERAAG